MSQLYGYYDGAHADVSHNPQIEATELPWILKLIDYQRQRFTGEIGWIDTLMDECRRGLGAAQGEPS
jgi:hypothetical protein